MRSILVYVLSETLDDGAIEKYVGRKALTTICSDAVLFVFMPSGTMPTRAALSLRVKYSLSTQNDDLIYVYISMYLCMYA